MTLNKLMDLDSSVMKENVRLISSVDSYVTSSAMQLLVVQYRSR